MLKKTILSAAVIFLGINSVQACAWYDPDYEYFSLFTQELIHNKSYEPFLLTESSHFYGDATKRNTPDENIESWQKYFNNTLSYEETEALVKVIDIKHLYNLKKGILSHDLFKKLGKEFYTQYKEALDYLIQAKYMEPYMRFGEETVYRNNDYDHPVTLKSAAALPYTKTVAALISLYKAAKQPEIKLRYAYQLVRFHHYTRNYKNAVTAFDTYAAPLKNDTPIYWYALDQKAGAQRGLKLLNDANWNFFQVFIHSRNRKESAYNSMYFMDDANFEALLKRAKTPEEQNMAYFLIAYNGFTNPLAIMKKMYANKANSEILKVLTARSINELERTFLPITLYCEKDCDKMEKRLPTFSPYTNYSEKTEVNNYSQELMKFLEQVSQSSSDVYWQISYAYVQFLNNDYAASQSILSKISTTDQDYLVEIEKMKMLNDIVSQPKITPEFEKQMMVRYATFFNNNTKKSELYWENLPTTKDFIFDILANRYFLQGEHAKSYLMNNTVSNLQYNPSEQMVKAVDAFYKKTNKSNFEELIAKNGDDVVDAEAFFNVIYGDKAMRNAEFALAKSYYQKAVNFKGIPRVEYHWDEKTEKDIVKPMSFGSNDYNGFQNISSLIFGHNVWESFGSKPEETMKAEDTSKFSFIKPKMNKFELADALLQLQNIGNGTDLQSIKANQLIGNVLYNTSILGYYREVFVMDVDNANGPKFHFWNVDQPPFHHYYKNYASQSFIDQDNFDLAINFYQKSFALSKDREQKARLLFQMASAEQGKYYQWEIKNSKEISWDDPKHDEKEKIQENLLMQTKTKNYRTYFAALKNNYSDTKTEKSLRTSCLFYGDYTSK